MSSDTKYNENNQKYIKFPYCMNSIVKKVQNNEYFIKQKTVILKYIVEWIEKLGCIAAQY